MNDESRTDSVYSILGVVGIVVIIVSLFYLGYAVSKGYDDCERGAITRESNLISRLGMEVTRTQEVRRGTYIYTKNCATGGWTGPYFKQDLWKSILADIEDVVSALCCLAFLIVLTPVLAIWGVARFLHPGTDPP